MASARGERAIASYLEAENAVGEVSRKQLHHHCLDRLWPADATVTDLAPRATHDEVVREDEVTEQRRERSESEGCCAATSSAREMCSLSRRMQRTLKASPFQRRISAATR